MNPDEITLHAGLYCVPTPIGNLRDITLRALDVLKSCDAVVCEDTRVTGKLLNAYDISVKKIVYNDHSSEETRKYILSLIRDEGKALALVSDAGTPMISDPGYKLMVQAIEEGVYVTALPGANAVLPAIQLSGLPSDKFSFCGFLPHKTSGVQSLLQSISSHQETVIFYDTAQRLPKNLTVVKEVLGNRKVAVVREISKLYEEAIRGTVDEVLMRLDQSPLKGEIVLVIEGMPDADVGAVDIDALIRQAMANDETVKEFSARIAQDIGVKRQEIYNRALELRDE